ncbi:MAG TPA: CAP domain-containing protein [Terriglobia bacterium]|nr:CAP domain-containing protein [Terriglobia bacterium]
MKASFKNGTSTRFGTALTMLIASACFAAPPQGNAGKQPERGANSATMVALASAPEMPALTDPACPGYEQCEGMGIPEMQMLSLVNADRLNPANDAETGGQALPLKWDPRLAQAALEHSEDMALHHYFSHYDLAGGSPVDRISRMGVPWRSLGENIAKNFTVVSAEEAFMNEPRFQPNHRANILNRKFNYVGIGIVRGPDGMIYATQEFAQEP